MKTTWKDTEVTCTFHALHEDIPLTIGQFCEGVAITGGSGSGKTSSGGKHIPIAMLKQGWGGLVLCAKPDEAERFASLAKHAGRERDLVFFNAKTPHRFNFLNEELQSEGGVKAVSSLFAQIYEAVMGGKSERTVWDGAAESLIEQFIDLFRLSGKSLELSSLYAVITDEKAQDSLLQLAKMNALDEGAKKDLLVVEKYIVGVLRGMAAETKGSIMMNVEESLKPFLKFPMRELFCSDTTISPRDLRHGKIIIVDMAAEVYENLGIAAAMVWKVCTQRVLGRYFGENGALKATDRTRPVFIFADECQYFITSKDYKFQTTARSKRVASVYLTQNIANLHLAAGNRGKEVTSSLLGNLQTKILCQNSCPETYDWFMRVLGKELQDRTGVSANVGQQGGGTGGGGASVNIQRDVILDAKDFHLLARGGPKWRKVVTAIMIQSGSTFKDSEGNEKLWTQIAFPQGQRV